MLRLFSSFWVLIGVTCITEHLKFSIICLDMDVLSTASVTIHNAQLNAILNPRTWRWQPTDNLLSGHVECWGKTVRESCHHASLPPHSNISRQEWQLCGVSRGRSRTLNSIRKCL